MIEIPDQPGQFVVVQAPVMQAVLDYLSTRPINEAKLLFDSVQGLQVFDPKLIKEEADEAAKAEKAAGANPRGVNPRGRAKVKKATKRSPLKAVAPSS